MTNEEKERLKDFVSDGASFIEGWRSNHSTKTKEKIEEEIDRDKQTILALIDRVPSEGHLKLINMVLSQINSREMWATRADYEMARMALDRIRKALGLEEG